MPLDLARHPCFDDKARHQYGRVHLPVAPLCNIQCNFCDRRFDCPNESRPGVTSTVLTPPQALQYFQVVRDRVPALSVVGIAGPGDPFANASETLETLRLIRAADPDVLLCVATNGLQIGPHIEDLAALEVSHVTLTVNAVDPEISRHIYAWVRDGKQVLRGPAAAARLLDRQLQAIKDLKASGITVKINTIAIPDLNEDHIPEVAETVAAHGADVFNCIPMYPVAQTPFADRGTVPPDRVAALRAAAGTFLPQMSHCARCRADAIGKLGEAMAPEVLDILQSIAKGGDANRAHVAVASAEGLLVNLHLGEADQFQVYDELGRCVDTRPAPASGQGADRWRELAARLHDCRAVLVSGVGEAPRRALKDAGLDVVLTEGLVADAIRAVFGGRQVSPPRKIYRCGEVCSGQGQGCG